MNKVSIIIPSRNEKYMPKTVEDILNKAKGDFEVIVVLDGQNNYPLTFDDPRLLILENKNPVGMRDSINMAITKAKGNYLLKTDAHCIFSEGFDLELQKNCDDKSVVIARRFTLDPTTWDKIDRMPVDYYYLSCPWTHTRFQIQSPPWLKRTKERDKIMFDETMSFQGSMWFMTKKHFETTIGTLSNEGYGDFVDEPLEIGLKTWLSGGRIMVNKNVWYAHMHKRYMERGFDLSSRAFTNGQNYAADYWTKNKWPGRTHDFDWLVDRFWPLPTEKTLNYGEKYFWPEDWRKYYRTK